jgi:hypothetical protein
MKKIFMRLSGGLGNQMFQYAAGRALALRHNATLHLDIDGYEAHNNNKRSYELTNFNISGTVYCSNYTKFWWKNKISKIILNIRGLSYKEPNDFIQDDNFFKIKIGSYLQGYFQSFHYFQDIESTIRNEFTFKRNLKSESDRYLVGLLNDIEQRESICVHIRRGDYLANDSLNICGLKYYNEGLKIIAERINNPHCVVFSDDIDWVAKNFKPSLPTTLIYPTADHPSSLYLELMSSCKHFVISNSTYSWWAAWLASNKTKIIVAPKLWQRNFAGQGLIPDGWIRA